jgi:hypothetical protein
MQSVAPYTDFQYDPKDVAKVQSAFNDLKNSETRGLYYGLGTWVFSYWAMGRTMKWSSGSRSIAALLLGATALNLYTHSARIYYESLSGEVNGRISKQLNSMIH